MLTLFDLNLQVGDTITVNRKTYEVIGVTSITIGLKDKKGNYEPDYVGWHNPKFNGKVKVHRKKLNKDERFYIGD